MSIQAHTLPRGTTKAPKRRVGRGNSSGRGTTAGRGTKGQRARSGGRSGLKRKAFKQALQKIPKLRGFRSIVPRLQTVTLSRLFFYCKPNETVTPALLKNRGLVQDAKRPVKIIGGNDEGAIPLTLRGCLLSKGALAVIEKNGGSVVF